MADSDPPYKIDNGESPGYRDVDAPDADALEEKIRNGSEQHHHDCEREGEADQPAARRLAGEDDGADLVGRSGISVARLKNRDRVEPADFVGVVGHGIIAAA